MTISPALEHQIKILVESFGLALYDIVSLKENENQILRVYITKLQNHKESKNTFGITLQECEEVSLALSPLLDVEVPNSKKYFLEVSSPGLERTLKTQAHYKSAIGELIRVKTIDKKEFKGKLLEVSEESLTIEMQGNTKKEAQMIPQTIPLNSIKKAQTYFEW